MPQGLSIHIGLNVIDAKHYGTNGKLPFCTNDATAMKELALKAGYKIQSIFLNGRATSTNILASLANAADKLDPGDILLVTYSGHGSFFPDLNGDEDDGYDETWVLFDRMLLDDELYYSWSKFKPGVRIILVSDSCHSGTVAKPLLLHSHGRKLDLPRTSSLSEILKAESLLLYKTHQQKYDQHLRFVPSTKKLNIGASVILLSGCGDKQQAIGKARSGRKFSLFTDELLTVYTKKTTVYTYKTFLEAIRKRIPVRLRQEPNLFYTGAKNEKFERQVPFSIDF